MAQQAWDGVVAPTVTDRSPKTPLWRRAARVFLPLYWLAAACITHLPPPPEPQPAWPQHDKLWHFAGYLVLGLSLGTAVGCSVKRAQKSANDGSYSHGSLSDSLGSDSPAADCLGSHQRGSDHPDSEHPASEQPSSDCSSSDRCGSEQPGSDLPANGGTARGGAASYEYECASDIRLCGACASDPSAGPRAANGMQVACHLRFSATFGAGTWTLSRWPILLAVLGAYGALDELTQPLFFRDAEVLDWLADVAGGALGLLIAWRLLRWPLLAQ